jgi:hypothetical protein
MAIDLRGKCRLSTVSGNAHHSCCCAALRIVVSELSNLQAVEDTSEYDKTSLYLKPSISPIENGKKLNSCIHIKIKILTKADH